MAYTAGLRTIGVNVSLFTLNGDTDTEEYIGDLSEATVSGEFETEEASGIADEYEYPVGVGQKWSLSGTLYANTTATIRMMTRAINETRVLGTGAQTVAVALTTGGVVSKAYSGTGIITACTHKTPKGLQTYDITITGSGALAQA
jgi:hypothetical protein